MLPWRFAAICVFLILSITQMFQTPALIVMSIGATRIHRSLTDFTDSGYYASCLSHSLLMLTAADIAVLKLLKYIRFERGA